VPYWQHRCHDQNINLGKLQYVTNLNLAASYGDDFPYIHRSVQPPGQPRDPRKNQPFPTTLQVESEFFMFESHEINEISHFNPFLHGKMPFFLAQSQFSLKCP